MIIHHVKNVMEIDYLIVSVLVQVELLTQTKKPAKVNIYNNQVNKTIILMRMMLLYAKRINLTSQMENVDNHK